MTATTTPKSFASVTTPDGLTIAGPMYEMALGFYWLVTNSDRHVLARIRDRPEMDVLEALHIFRDTEEERSGID